MTPWLWLVFDLGLAMCWCSSFDRLPEYCQWFEIAVLGVAQVEESGDDSLVYSL